MDKKFLGFRKFLIWQNPNNPYNPVHPRPIKIPLILFIPDQLFFLARNP